jgi:hypothetical protein
MNLPGADPTDTEDHFDASRVDWDDVRGVVLSRYGHADPTAADIASGSGQHAGSMTDLQNRFLSALHFIASRWPEPELRRHVESDSADNAAPGTPACEIEGSCTLAFTSKSTGRSGPVVIALPPGYANKSLQGIRYPVVFILHGYGQDPTDLASTGPLLRDLMNTPDSGQDSRLAKAILVYVDGRCRVTGGKAECSSGTFFADSPRPGGAEDETWWLDLIDYIDQHYRTRGESGSSVTD